MNITNFNNPYLQQFQRSNIDTLSNSLFHKLDAQKQGVLTQESFQTSLEDIDDDAATTASQMMQLFDTDQDGAVTLSEFSQQLQSVQTDLNAQYDELKKQMALDLTTTLLESMDTITERHKKQLSLYEHIQEDTILTKNKDSA